MTHDEFEVVFNQIVDACRATLVAKGREYTPDHDRFHNFTTAAELMGMTPEQALGGFLAKHLVSVYDLLRKPPEEVSLAMWNEKIGDALNYLILLQAMIIERQPHFQLTFQETAQTVVLPEGGQLHKLSN